MRPRPLARASSPTPAPTLARASSLALALACSPPAPRAPDPDQRDEVRAEQDPLADADLARLDALIAARAPLHWRVRGPDGPRCEPWRLEPDPDDPHRGRLVHAAGASRLSFTYQLQDGHLRLTDPTRERDTPVAPPAPTPGTRVAAGVMTLALAFPCVFSGMSLTPAAGQAARRLVLAGHERWFLDAEACAAAGPDQDPQPAAPGELHPIGCASALADPATRERDAARPPGPAAARLRAARRLYMLRDRDGRTACEAWRRSEAADDSLEGSLERTDRDDHGRRTIRYGYALLGDTLTLLGPHEFRRLRTQDGPLDVTRARGCLLTRPLALRGDVVFVGDDPWFTTRRACERARRAGAPARPHPDCGPA